MRRPDRPLVRTPTWIGIDVLAAAFLVFLVVDAFRGSAWQAEHGALTGTRWALLLLPSLLVAVRRLAPVACLGLATVALVAGDVDLDHGNAVLAAPFLVYVVALAHPPDASRWLVAAAGLPVAAVALQGGDDPVGAVVIALFYGVPWVVALRVRRARTRGEALEAETAGARAAAEDAARQAVADERARIARELHDAVGHAVSVIVMQAGAARLVTRDEPAGDALRNIEAVGRSALGDLDRMLGLLREEGATPTPLEPAHGVDDIAGLVERVRAAGLEVTVERACRPEERADLDGPVSTAAYRIVQESLTNVAKHAGRAAVRLSLDVTPDELVVRVVDDGRGAASSGAAGGGRGIPGMRERVKVLGGTLRAGPRSGGGYEVLARLPRRPASS